MTAILGVTDIIQDLHNYDVELGHVSKEREKGNASIRIGGSDSQKFVPNINASKWNDEAFLNINYSDTTITAEQETFTDDKVEISAGGLTHRFFKKDYKSLKHDIVIPSKPLSNHFTFDLTFSENLRFDHQDTLENDWIRFSKNGTVPVMGCNTLQEYLASNRRPENIINSYVVKLIGKKNNQYLTGKFCHIERVKFIDSTKKEIWAEQLIEVTSPGRATWTITVDQAWLDNAVYPIVLDPVMGYNSIGGSNEPSPTEMFFGCRYVTEASGGDIDDLNVYCDRSGAGVYFIVGVYDDTSGTLDGQDKVSANETILACPQSPAWITDSGITGTLTGSTDYWIAMELDYGLTFFYDTVTAGYEDLEHISPYTYDGALPDPAPTGLSSSPLEISMYVNYSAATQTITTSLDALIQKTISKNLSIDALLQKSIPITLSVDAILEALQTISNNLDAQLFKSDGKTLSIDALLQNLNVTKTASIDAILSSLKTIAGDLDAQLFKAYTKALSIDGLLQRLGVTTSISIDALLSKAGAQNVSLDAILYTLSGGAATVSIDALLNKSNVVAQFNIDALLQQAATETVSIDALLLKTITNSLVFDAYLQKQSISTLALDAHISKLETLSTGMDAILLGGGIFVDASLDALLQKIQLQTASLDALLYSGQIRTAALDAIVKGTLTATVDFDALLQKEGQVSTLMDAIIYSALAIATPKYDFISILVKPDFISSLVKPDFISSLVKPDFIYSA